MLYKTIVMSLLTTLGMNAQQGKIITFNELDKMDTSEARLIFPVKSPYTSNLIYTKDGFFVSNKKGLTQVKSYDTAQVLRGRSFVDVAKLGTLGTLRVSTYDNGDYKVDLHGDLKGGGVVGAWIGSALGYGVVTFVGHGGVFLVSCLAGPAQPAAFATLEKMCAIPIHSAASAAAVAIGVAGGVATGPV